MPFLTRVIPRRRRARNVQIHAGLDPIARVTPAAGKLPAISGAADLVLAQFLARELEIAAVQAVMHAEDEVRLVLAQDLEVVAGAERHLAAVEEAQDLDDRVEPDVHPGRGALDPIVEIHAGPVNDRGLLEHLLDPHVHIVPIKLEAPFRKRLGPGVVAGTGAGGQDKDADFRHVRLGRSTGPSPHARATPGRRAREAARGGLEKRTRARPRPGGRRASARRKSCRGAAPAAGAADCRFALQDLREARARRGSA